MACEAAVSRLTFKKTARRLSTALIPDHETLTLSMSGRSQAMQVGIFTRPSREFPTVNTCEGSEVKQPPQDKRI